MKRVNIGVAFVSLSLALAACSGGTSSSTAPPGGSSTGTSSQITIGSDNANDHGQASASGSSSLAVQQGDYYFSPTVISGSAGQKLTLHLTNSGTTEHSFTIDSLNVNVNLQPGQSKTVKVAFPTSGFTEFYCAFHRTLGMVGELKVG